MSSYETTTVGAARWKIASRSASSTFMPTAPVPRQCGPTSSGSGSPRSPTCWWRPYGAWVWFGTEMANPRRVDPPQAVKDRRSGDREFPPHRACLRHSLSDEGCIHPRTPAPARPALAARNRCRGLTATGQTEDHHRGTAPSLPQPPPAVMVSAGSWPRILLSALSQISTCGQARRTCATMRAISSFAPAEAAMSASGAAPSAR